MFTRCSLFLFSPVSIARFYSSTEFLREVSSASRCNLSEGGFTITSRSPWQHEEELCGDIKVVFVLGSEQVRLFPSVPFRPFFKRSVVLHKRQPHLANVKQGLFTLKTRRTRTDVGRELSEVFSSERRRAFRKHGTRSAAISSSSSGPMAPEVSIFAPPLQTYSRPPARRRAPKPVAALGSVVEIDTISNGVPIFEELETAVLFQEQLLRQGKDIAIAEITSGQVIAFC